MCNVAWFEMAGATIEEGRECGQLERPRRLRATDGTVAQNQTWRKMPSVPDDRRAWIIGDGPISTGGGPVDLFKKVSNRIRFHLVSEVKDAV
jgi:hypothetical protein